jgi:hypothetical protein
MKKLMFLMFALTIFTFIACNKDEAATEAEIENYVNQSIGALEAETRTGRGGCFELVFPVTIVFSTGEEVEVESYEALKNAIKNWRREHNVPKGTPTVRPQFVYPIDVITAEGETVTVDSKLELLQLRRECILAGNGQGRPCFKLNFPLSVAYPDGTTATYATGMEMRRALRAWKKANPTAVLRPVLVFPLTITMEDGTIVTVNSREELALIKQDCK